MENLNTTAFQTMQSIVKDKQAKEIEGVLVDMFTASTLLQAYEQVNDSNKRRIETSKLNQLIAISHIVMGSERYLEMVEEQSMIIDQGLSE